MTSKAFVEIAKLSDAELIVQPESKNVATRALTGHECLVHCLVCKCNELEWEIASRKNLTTIEKEGVLKMQQGLMREDQVENIYCEMATNLAA